MFINVYNYSKYKNKVFVLSNISLFREKLKMDNNLLLRQNEEQFAIEEQVQQVQVSK
jgi:hypothetical protein